MPHRSEAPLFSLATGNSRENFSISGADSCKINNLRVIPRTIAGKVFSLPSAWQGIGRETQDKKDSIDSPTCF
jgi:hypothetical protein